jgi:glycosyltransferase involved in cell wall biosynthesis
VLRPLGGRPYLLHVGSAEARKRLDVLFEVFAGAAARTPELRLVQLGAVLTDEQRRNAERLGVAPERLLQPPKQPRATVAGLYRRAALVLMPSEAEGFGLPVAEALACGAPVIASAIPPLAEVGGDAVRYRPPGDVDAWTAAVESALSDPASMPDRAARLERAGRFSWRRHAATVVSAYLRGPR